MDRKTLVKHGTRWALSLDISSKHRILLSGFITYCDVSWKLRPDPFVMSNITRFSEDEIEQMINDFVSLGLMTDLGINEWWQEPEYRVNYGARINSRDSNLEGKHPTTL